MDTDTLTELDRDAAVFAAQGAAALDSKPALDGWRDMINLDTLDVLALDKCIIGQLFPSYSQGIEFLAPEATTYEERDRFAYSHGFDTNGGFSSPSYVQLTAAWRNLLQGGAA